MVRERIGGGCIVLKFISYSVFCNLYVAKLTFV